MNGAELESLRRVLAAGEDAVWVGVAATRGSVPRDTGTGMVVTATGLWGSIGGGHLEYEALRIAREALASIPGNAQWLVRFPLAARLGQCCGGVATLAFTRMPAGAYRWLDAACEWLRAGRPFTLLSRVDAPASGQVLAIAEMQHEGSLGDPRLDSAALETLHPGSEARSGVTELEGAQCLVRTVRPDAFHVAVFGNGHVGRALVQLLGVLPLEVQWIDEREADFPAVIPANARVSATDAPASEVPRLAAGAAVVVTTHSHALDFEIAHTSLARGDLAYVGMIGSASKRRQFESRALARGLDAACVARLVCPIGVPLFGGKEPGVVALAVAAELQVVREQRAGIAPRHREAADRAAAPSAPHSVERR